ncbi:acyltransferase [Halobellus rarus]|uniref:Acyltransferase n=1 Tax=Halobellus rarus TaxID=1126237 RepID=A0ABD6CJ80_9EURY|nr:acyltransferase [Halobellus rarus]
METIRSAVALLSEKGPVTFSAIVRSRVAGELRRLALNARHNTSIHRSATVDWDTKFGTDGRIRIGQDCRIRKNAVIMPSGGRVRIGSNSLVNVFGTLLGQGGLEIGRDVLIGPHTTVVAANHTFENPDVPIDEQELSREGVEIGDDVWIGSNCTVLDGVTVGEGSVIAAGSVVTESVPEYTVVAGVPAEPIGTRD